MVVNQDQRREFDKVSLFIGYSRVLKHYKDLIESEKYSEALIIGSSLFEERVTSCWLIREWWERSKSFELDCQPSVKETTSFENSISYKIRYLEEKGYLSKTQMKKSIGKLEIRNRLVHMYIWNYESITAEDCDKIFRNFRFFDKLSSKIKRELNFK